MNMASGSGLLHQLTSYSPEREWDVPADHPLIRQDLTPNDPETVPPQVKEYEADLPRVALPRDLPTPDISATDVLAGCPASSLPLDAAQLGRILFLGAGVVRTAVHRIGPVLFRASGSAGARFPLEVYASTRDVDGVPDGVHWYDPVEHSLVQIGPPANGDATTIVVTGIPWRTGWRYSERGWRHLFWDAGTLLSQMHAATASAGLAPALRTLFPDEEIAALVGADGVHEYPLALLTFGAGTPAVEATEPAVRGSLPEVEFPLCTLAQQAGSRARMGESWPEGAPVADAPPSEELDTVILRRGSQRLMDPSRSLPRASLEWPLTAALRGIDVPHWVAVHNVNGVEPGIYRWPDLQHPVRAGDFRKELLHICLDQDLASDAAYVVIAATPSSLLDDRTYRDAQLAAGMVEGRLHLAAYALGAGASGMTFLDSEVPALLGESEDLVTLLFTCVGFPEYKSRAGGKPGAPVEVKAVHPRLSS